MARKEAVFFDAGRAVLSDGTELEVSASAIAAVEAGGTVPGGGSDLPGQPDPDQCRSER